MIKRVTALYFAICILFSASAQQTQADDPSPYSINPVTDGAIILGGIGLTGLGVKLINDKKDLTPSQLAAKSKDDIPFFDKGNAGFYSQSADDASYIPFHASFALPVVMALVNKNERQKFLQVTTLYVETMAITGTLFTITAGTINRSRPYVYNTTIDANMRRSKNAQRAFFAGHTAASAGATFFMAKAFQDFNPGSKAIPYVWAGAAAIPAVVGYLRYKAGMHFLSDNILGYVIGAGTGILVPQLHKVKALKNVSISPSVRNNAKELYIAYRF